MKQFYILFLIIVSVFFIFVIGTYTNEDNVIIEGKGKKGAKPFFKKLGKSITKISKTIIKKLNNNLNPVKLARQIKNKKKKRKNRERNKRIQKYIRILNTIYNYSISSAPIDYLQLALNDFYNFYIGNHAAVYEVWVNVKPQTRTYFKEKYKRFLEIKQKIFDKINLRKKVYQPILLISSSRIFDLPAETTAQLQGVSIIAPGSSSVTSSDYSKNIFEQVQSVVETVRYTNTEPEAFTDFFGNSDNEQFKKKNNKISIPYYVNLYDEYAESAYFKSYDKIEIILKSYETFFEKSMYEVKHAIDGINQGPSVEKGVTIEKGQTLNYLNTKLEFLYTIVNTIEQKTAYGIQLIS